MALLLPRSIFYHIPKTGGGWVRSAIKAAGISTAESGKSLFGHDTFKAVKPPGKFTFAFVRNPLTWYPSFWSYRMMYGWRTDDILDICMASNFEAFMNNVIKYLPGHLTLRYEGYVGRGDDSLDFVGRQETLAEDLVRALRMAGEEFDEDKILSTPRVNVSNGEPIYSEPLLEAIIKSESRIMTRFGYTRLNGIGRHEPAVISGLPDTETLTRWVPGAFALGNSMLPFFRSQDKLWHEPVETSSIQIGDVITFDSGRKGFVTHRVVRVQQLNGHPVFLTKGDNRLEFDPLTLPEHMIGRVVRAGQRDLTRPWWRFLGKIVAVGSFYQGKVYARLKNCRWNRARHAFERRGWLPRVRLREGFKLVTNPVLSIAAGITIFKAGK